MYIATINVPGYLPEDDDLATFETVREAWEYLAFERARHEAAESDDQAETASGEYSDTYYSMANMGSGVMPAEVGAVYGPTPGYQGGHDLGLAYTVSAAEED